MDLDESPGAGGLMQAVDVLCHQEEVAAAFDLPALEIDQSPMRRIRLGAVDAGEALQVPLPLPHRIPLEVVVSRHLDVVLPPDRTRLRPTEGRNTAGVADPGAGDDQQEAVTEASDLVVQPFGVRSHPAVFRIRGSTACRRSAASAGWLRRPAS